jgi:hypothetical protein
VKDFNNISEFVDADSGDDAQISIEKLEAQLAYAYDQIKQLRPDHHPLEKAEIQVKIAGTLVDLERGEEGHREARGAFDVFTQSEMWDGAVQCCDVMFQAGQDDSLVALGNGVWLAVTFPVNPELCVNLLHHIIEETPDDSDGAAVAAAVAHYVVDIRATEKKLRDNLLFFTNQLLGSVARRHSKVESQEQFDYWTTKMELNDPAKFLPRMRNVVDVMVQEDWWVDRDAIWASLPDQ